MRAFVANIGGAAVVLLLLEIVTSLVGPRFPAIPRPGDSDRGLWVYDARKGWFHAPGARGRSDLGGPDRGEVRINSLGLRGGEIARAKAPGVRRVLVVGDSFVFGVGVDEARLLTSQLGRLLGPAVEVVNMGVSGYSTDQELLLFEDVGAALGPDLVLLFAVDNDFEGNARDFMYQAYYKPYFAPADGLALRNVPVPPLTRAQQARLWLGRRSNLWNAARSRWAPFQVATPMATTDDELGLMHELLRLFRRRVDAAGATFVLFNTGHRGERTPLFQELRPRLRRDGFRFLGLEGTMGEARATSGRWDFGRDTHWNVDAHRLAAQVVAEYLRRADLIQ